MKKNTILFWLLGLTSIILAWCSQTLPPQPSDTELSDLSIEQMSEAIKQKGRKRYQKIKNQEIPMEDWYYKLSKEEQKEYFFFQKSTTNRDFFIPGVSYMQVEAVPWGFCTPTEDEGVFPLSYKWKLAFYGEKVRYPFIMKPQFFKDFTLSGTVNNGKVEILFSIPHYKENKENYDLQTKTFTYKAGESFTINPRVEEIAPKDPSIEDYKIYISSKEIGSQMDYEFIFQDNTQ